MGKVLGKWEFGKSQKEVDFMLIRENWENVPTR